MASPKVAVSSAFQPLAGQAPKLPNSLVSPANIFTIFCASANRYLPVRLGKLFGDGAAVWVRMQAVYDTWNAERKEDVSKIFTLRAKAA
jgi:hypothetical protein